MTVIIKTNMAAKKLQLRMGKLDMKLRDSIRTAFQQIGSQLVVRAHADALQPKYGREYPRYENGKREKPDHRASKDLQSPAVLSGNYFERFGYNTQEFQLEFFNDAEYAEFLEDGTDTMGIRPGLENAVNSTTATFREYFETNLGEALDLEG